MTNLNRFDDNVDYIINRQNQTRAIREVIGSLVVGLLTVAFAWLLFAM